MSFPLYDVPLLSLLVEAAGLSSLVRQPWQARRAFWDPFLAELRDAEGFGLGTTVRTILTATHRRLAPEVRLGSQYAVRTRIASLIRQARHDVGTPSRWHEHHGGGSAGTTATEALLADACASLEAMAVLVRGGPGGRGHGRPEYGSGRSGPVDDTRPVTGRRTDPGERGQPGSTEPATAGRPKLLLLTATQVETKSLLNTFEQVLGPRAAPLFGEHTTYFRLGVAHGCDVYLAQSDAGSIGPGGSMLTTYDALRFLDPALVIMAGIAFGARPAEQQVGDILVSRQVVAYESQRVGGPGTPSRLVPRGDRVSASPRLLDRCRTVDVDWHLSAVHFGLLLSGEKLIDSTDYLDQVAAQFGHEAVGGEMEGAGLYAAAYRQRKEWVVVKAISD